MIRVLDWLVGMGSAVMVTMSQTASSSPIDILSLLEKFGPLVGVIAYFLMRDQSREKRDQQRENRMAKRIDALEDYQSSEMSKQLQNSMTIIEKNVKALDSVATAITYCREQGRV